MSLRHKAVAAAMAVLVVTGLMSAAARGATFQAESYPPTLTANTEHVFAFGPNRKTSCSVSFEQVVVAPTLNLSLFPKYSSCSYLLLSTPMKVTTNNCNFTVEPKSYAEGISVDSGFLDCPAGQSITLEIFETETQYTKNEVACTYSIGPQGPFSGETKTTNIGTGKSREILLSMDVQLKALITQVKFKGLCGGEVGKVLLVSYESPGLTSAETLLKGEKSGTQIGIYVE